MTRFLTALFCLAFGLNLALTSAQAETFNAAEKKSIEAVVQDYLMQNPEALASALQNMQVYYEQADETRIQRTIAQNAELLFRNKADFSMGPVDAPVTIVEFFDYNCGYCKRVFPVLMEVVNQRDDVRVVFKEFPILSDSSEVAARTALTLDNQLNFLTFHARLMNNKAGLNDGFISQTLADLELDERTIVAQRSSQRITDILDENRQLAQALDVAGTPAFVIGNQVYPGALEKHEFEAAIEAALAVQSGSAN